MAVDAIKACVHHPADIPAVAALIVLENFLWCGLPLQSLGLVGPELLRVIAPVLILVFIAHNVSPQSILTLWRGVFQVMHG